MPVAPAVVVGVPVVGVRADGDLLAVQQSVSIRVGIADVAERIIVLLSICRWVNSDFRVARRVNTKTCVASTSLKSSKCVYERRSLSATLSSEAYLSPVSTLAQAAKLAKKPIHGLILSCFQCFPWRPVCLSSTTDRPLRPLRKPCAFRHKQTWQASCTRYEKTSLA